MGLGDEVREVALKSYFHLCKEKQAKAFIDWRIEVAELCRDQSLKQALRLRLIASKMKHEDKEEQIFQLYMNNRFDFAAVRDELVTLELEIQKER